MRGVHHRRRACIPKLPAARLDAHSAGADGEPGIIPGDKLPSVFRGGRNNHAMAIARNSAASALPSLVPENTHTAGSVETGADSRPLDWFHEL